MQKLNAKQWPQTYRCKFLTAGLVSYEDSGAGIALLKKETIDRMLHSFIGKPVCIEHHDITPENYNALRGEGIIVGNVTGVEFNPGDGWYYADFIVDTDEGINRIDVEGDSVSCAYNVLDAVEGSTYQDIKYDGEITEGSFTHLALVAEPRYEESKITKQSPMMLLNGKVKAYQEVNREDKDMFKIFKKNAKGEQETYTGSVVNIDGQEMPVDHLIKNFQDITAKEAEELKKKEDAKKNAKHVMNDKDIIDIAGNKVCIGDMIAKVKGAMVNDKAEEKKEEEKVNEKPEEKKEEEKKDNAKEEEKPEEKKEEKANDKEEEKVEEKANEKEEDKKEEKKENAKAKGDEFFAELHNASHSFAPEEGARITPSTREERSIAWAKKNSK